MNDADWDQASAEQRTRMIGDALGNRKIGHEKIERLLYVVEPQDLAMLKSFHNTVMDCISDYQAAQTFATQKKWMRAESALEACIINLLGKYFEPEKTLPNPLAVSTYLSAQGWKVRKSTVYNHLKEGKFHPRADGFFLIEDIDRYAETYLKRKDGTESPKFETLQHEKLVAEIDKTKAQARHWSMKAEIFTGAYVPKDLFEKELAKRCALFKNDLETFARSEAPEFVACVAGDPGKISDLIELMLRKIENVLSRYAEEGKVFHVPLPIIPDDKHESDRDEDEESDE
jgi:hypothetical protein